MRLHVRLIFGLVFAASVAGAQSDLNGVVRLKPGLLHPSIIEQLPRTSRSADSEGNVTFHETVPLKVRFVPGKRQGEYSVESTPDLNLRKFILPNLLNAKLEYRSKRQREHRWEVSEGNSGPQLQSQSGTTARIRNHEIVFLDLNHDGAFGGGSDGWIAKGPKDKQWAKPGEKIAFHMMMEGYEIDGVKLWFQVEPTGFGALVTDQQPDFSAKAAEDKKEALAFLNEQRAALGFAPVTLDPELSLACEAHALYCSLNSIVGHGEDPSKPGYSKEGADAGPKSVVASGPSMKETVFFWLTSFYHRLRMLSPNLMAVGMGYAKGYGVMDDSSFVKRDDFEPYAWPPDGAKGLPVGWLTGEHPSPTGIEPFDGGGQAREFGYPVTLTFCDGKVRDAKATLLVNGEPMEFFFSTPERPGNPTFKDNMRTVFLMSKPELPPKATCKVLIECTWRGKPFRKEWSFTTR